MNMRSNEMKGIKKNVNSIETKIERNKKRLSNLKNERETLLKERRKLNVEKKDLEGKRKARINEESGKLIQKMLRDNKALDPEKMQSLVEEIKENAPHTSAIEKRMSDLEKVEEKLYFNKNKTTTERAKVNNLERDLRADRLRKTGAMAESMLSQLGATSSQNGREEFFQLVKRVADERDERKAKENLRDLFVFLRQGR